MTSISATVPSGTIVECSKACLGPLDPGTVVLEIPEGFLRGQEANFSFLLNLLALSRAPFFRWFFWHCLGTLIFQILVPTWVQLACQLGAKIHPNPCQEGSKYQANLHHIFDTLFDRFWVPFGLNFGRFWVPSWRPSWPNNRSYGLLLASWPT